MPAPPDNSRVLLVGALLLLVAVLGYGAFTVWRTPIEVELDEPRPQLARATPMRAKAKRREPVRPREPESNHERRPDLSDLRAARQAEAEPEPEQREVLEDGGPPDVDLAAVSPAGQPNEAPANEHADGAPIVDYSKPALDAAMAELGVDTTKYVELETRYQEMEEDEVKLRQQAATEGWLNSPNFKEEMDAIEADRQALRAEIGDEAYDYFLFSMGKMNRVFVTNVEQHSPADVAGLQSGDVIVRYGGTRVFTAVDMVNALASNGGTDTVTLDIMRQGNRMRVESTSGGRGIAFAATQEPPLSAN